MHSAPENWIKFIQPNHVPHNVGEHSSDLARCVNDFDLICHHCERLALSNYALLCANEAMNHISC